MSRWKQFLGGLGAVLLGFLLMGIQKSDSQAEFSFNDAQDIQVNSYVSGNVTQGHDEERNYYKFTVSNDGYVVLNFSNPLQKDSGHYWTIGFFDSEYTLLCPYILTYGNNTTTDSPAIGIAAGTYYISIDSSTRWGAAASEDTYTMSVQYTASDVWEKELNEDYLSATEIATGTEYYGSITNGFDSGQDYYKFEVAQDGYVTLHFTNPLQSNSDIYWDVDLYNGRFEWLCWSGIYGNLTSGTFPSIGIPAGTYYIRIKSPRRYEAASTDTYTIMAEYIASDVWEKEFNEDFVSATSMTINQEYFGTTRAGYKDEKDYYSFTIDKEGKYAVEIFTSDMKDDERYWEMFLYDSTYEEKEKIDVRGNQTNHAITQTLSPGIYYIKVNSTHRDSAASIEPYCLKVSLAKTLDSITATKVKTNYKAGDSLDTSDITVMANYSDGTSEDVTNLAEFDTSAVNMYKAGNYHIWAKYQDSTISVTIKVTEESTSDNNTDINHTDNNITDNNSTDNDTDNNKPDSNSTDNNSTDSNKPDSNSTDNNNTDSNKPDNDNQGNNEVNTTPAVKKSIGTLKVTAKRNKKTIKVRTVKNSKVKIVCYKKIFYGGKKTYTINMGNSKNKTVYLPKKLTVGTILRVKVSKSGYKSRTKIIIIL